MTPVSTRRRRRARDAGAHDASIDGPIRVRGAFRPDVIYAQAGRPIRVAFLRDETAACSERVLFPAFGKSAMLPSGQMIVVDLPASPPGTYEFTCAMGILRGSLVVR